MALNINGTTGISGVDGSASAPALTGTDSNTGINFASDTVNINTGGSTRASIDSSGNLGIGTTNPAGESINGSQNLVIMDTTSDGGMNIKTGTSGNAQIHFSDTSGNGQGRLIYAHANDSMQMYTAGSERLRITNGGLVLIRNTSALINESGLGVKSGGNTCVFKAEGSSGHNPLICWNNGEQGTRQQIQFGDGVSYASRGSITTNGGNVSYGGTSDYRKKQDDVLITDGIEKIKLLKPKRFKWKDALDVGICDGFFAHEVQEVIPTAQAVIGTKDEVETTYYIEGDTIPDGKAVGDVKDTDVPVYQQMDQSKLVPLLTAALQEAVAKIEVLEAKVAALEAG